MKPIGSDGIHSLIARLRELIAALDRRTPRPERTSETEIAAEAAALREEAVERLAKLAGRRQA